MKRFFKNVEVTRVNGLFRVELDGKALHSPQHRCLEFASLALAEGVANEWRKQGEEINTFLLPLTQSVNTALDGVGPARESAITQITAYGNSDLVCYRVESPEELKSKQDTLWDPLLERLNSEYGIRLIVTRSIAPVKQSDKEIEKIREIISPYGDLKLSALLDVTSLTGSFVLGIALFNGWISGHRAGEVAFLDELYQESLWGVDQEALDRRNAICTKISNVERFLNLLSSPG
jgi:chaperone required for assembly of F1-ATPase